MTARWTIYLITCNANGKQYVGMTKHSAYKRMEQHLEYAKKGARLGLLHHAINKYGAFFFVVSELCVCFSRADANYAERALIAQHNSLKPLGYNMTPGGDGCSGLKWSEEQKAAARKIHKALSQTPEGFARHSRLMKGKKRTPQDRAARSAAMKAWWAKRRAEGKKNNVPQEVRDRSRAALIGNKRTLGMRWKNTPETIERRKESLRKYHEKRRLKVEAEDGA